jgi:hypothetical protein
MGAHAYWYFVPYESNVQHALDTLREREFKAGRYSPVVPILNFRSPDFLTLQPGPKHKSIADALRDSAEDGTASILDISKVSDHPDCGVAAPAPPALLRSLFGTEYPTHLMLERSHDLFDAIARGQCLYVVVYNGDEPSELYFVGYSYD